MRATKKPRKSHGKATEKPRVKTSQVTKSLLKIVAPGILQSESCANFSSWRCESQCEFLSEFRCEFLRSAVALVQMIMKNPSHNSQQNPHQNSHGRVGGNVHRFFCRVASVTNCSEKCFDDQSLCLLSRQGQCMSRHERLHINNVNGFRYLGYSLTCPPMQAEILVLIAPVVPFYRFFVLFSSAVTFLMLITGGIARESKALSFRRI